MTFAQKTGIGSGSPSFTPHTEKQLQSDRNELSAPQHLKALGGAEVGAESTIAGGAGSLDGVGAGPKARAWLPISRGKRMALIDAEDFERCIAFRWQLKIKHSSPGKFYAQRCFRLTPGRSGKKGNESLHRFLMGCEPGDGKIVDHLNGNGLDNRKENLRITDSRGNATNVTESKNQKRGGYKGVSWHQRGQKWEASIASGEIGPSGKRKKVYLGLFDDPVEAAKAYDREARAHFGEFACCNFPLTEGVARAS